MSDIAGRPLWPLKTVGAVVAMGLWGASLLWLDGIYLQHRAATVSLWRGLPGLLRFALHNAHWSYYLGFVGLALVGVLRGQRGLVRTALAYLLAQLVISVLLARALKISIGRPRPGVEGAWLPGSLDSAHHSLPSGHATDVAVGATCVAHIHPGRWILSVSLLPLLFTCADRLLEGVHHPSDVLAGLLLGSVATSLISGRIEAMLGRIVPNAHHGET